MLHMYEKRMPAIRAAAERCGYAVGVHGSGERDLDLIAAPWIESALDAEALVDAICDSVSGQIINFAKMERNPAIRPHGRRAWSIHISPGLYIDLSVMPIVKDQHWF